MNAAFHFDVAKALITGINGFTGRHLTAELRAAGYVVVGLGTSAKATRNNQEIYHCDLTDRAVVAEIVKRVVPDVVVHLAAISFAAHGDVDAIYRVNLLGARNLLEAICDGGGKPRAILLASSANIYGNALVDVIDESVLAAPANDYAVAKLAMEYMACLWADRLPITIVRPFNYTGVGQSEAFLLPKIVSHFRRRAPVIELGNLEVVRDFSDVRSVVRSYRRLLECETSGEIFNICSGIGHSLEQVLGIMRDLSGHFPEVSVNQTYVRANEIKKLIGSKAKLEARIGPLENIPLHETLRWMYQAVDT